MQPYLQLVATIYSTTHATLKKSVENYIWLHNKLQLVANDKKRGPLRANIISPKQEQNQPHSLVA